MNHYTNPEEIVNEALKSDPGFVLPTNFADRMAEKAERKFVWIQFLKEFLIYLGTITGLVAVAITMVIVSYGVNWEMWLFFTQSNTVWIAAASLLLMFILFADRVLLQYFLYRSTSTKS